MLNLRRFAKSTLVLLSATVLGGGAALSSDNYKLMAGDLVEVNVFQEKDLSGSFRVSGDGMINMPLIGSVRIGGSGEGAAAAALRVKLLDGYLVNPQVTVRVTEFAKVNFTVLGQVREAGSYSVSGAESINLLQAIGKAGGFTRLSNERNVTVKRRVGGATKILKFDAKAMARDGKESGFRVRAGDIINVGESRF
jgi:polysaccharide export outer membrane protein